MNTTANRYYTATPYKGFVILQDNNSARCYVTKGGELYATQGPIVANGFKADGYGTLNTAKGAITKHLQATGAPFAGSTPAPAKAATSDDADRTSAPAQEWTRQQNLNGDPIHADPATAHTYALLDYYGMTKARDTRSRSKREGMYNGYTDGLHRHGHLRYSAAGVLFSSNSDHYMPTRKARKDAKMLGRAILAYKSANPAIYGKGA